MDVKPTKIVEYGPINCISYPYQIIIALTIEDV